MTHKTKGIVLRSVKYGETSLVVTVLTELFGLQSYMVNGVRAATKKGGVKTNPFMPAAILDLVVYRNEFKNLQRIKEYQWAYLYNHIFSDVRKNAVSLFIVELLTKCVKQPEKHAELFYFTEDALVHLDKATDAVVANFPLFFALHLAVFFGFRINDRSLEEQQYLDLREGIFVRVQPAHPHFLEGRFADVTSHILKIMQPEDLKDIPLNQDLRRKLLHAYQEFYALHLPDFGSLKTLPVLKEILS
ncbi:MAG: DNA repair protein RecO [Chitinophagaceae bacterium]